MTLQERATPALELRGVSAAYEKVEVLTDVSLTVPRGHVMALLGPNGAGKTTTMRIASARMAASKGEVLVKGEPVKGGDPQHLARRGVCCVPEGRGIFPNLTVAENLWMWSFAEGRKRADIEAQAFEQFPQLAARRTQLGGTLSGGEQQMLAMSRAWVTNSDLLLLDEISTGLAPKLVSGLYELVAQLAKRGCAILVVEQFAEVALGVADSAAVMIQGRVEMQGTPDQVREVLGDLYMRAEGK
jgi:branched-chain amino acid transport system ATP-binding protein